jgi:hypothetical protein
MVGMWRERSTRSSRDWSVMSKRSYERAANSSLSRRRRSAARGSFVTNALERDVQYTAFSFRLSGLPAAASGMRAKKRCPASGRSWISLSASFTKIPSVMKPAASGLFEP